MNMSNQKEHILIVDDEPEVRGIRHGLLSECYECTLASSAEEALTILHSVK